MSETIPRRQAEAADPTVRRLAYGDLPSVISIERRSFPAPWSLAMFVLELSKPSGVCLAATDGEQLLGYLVCCRYDQVWHLMNVAVSPDRRRAGVASRLIRPPAGGDRRRLGPADHPRGEGLQSRRDRDVRGPRLPIGRSSSPLLPGQRRGRADHVAGLILAIETSCDDTCAAVVDGGRSSPTRSPRRPRHTHALAASSPRSLRATTSSSSSRSSRTRSPWRAPRSTTSRRWR